MNRREWLGLMAGSGLGMMAGVTAPGQEPKRRELPEPKPGALPRWRGFNLLEMFMVDGQTPYREEDFALIAELGFDFVRLPMDYRCWAVPSDWTKFREDSLRQVDKAVGYGKKHGVHVQLNFHRAPGYTVAAPPEPKDLWTDREAQDVCATHWGHFAGRYQGVPNRELSFNLFNEPAKVGPEPHKKVVGRMVEAIREQDRDRLIVCDGRDWGTQPPTELAGLGVAAATRGYAPFHLTHYRANWVEGSDRWEKPTYPMTEGGKVWDAKRLQEDQIRPWKALEGMGVGVMVGEFGAFNRTPHDVTLAWMSDCLDAWKAAGWGWALWNFRGGFGVLDSDRTDVTYEDWRGHKLDRKMLNLLESH